MTRRSIAAAGIASLIIIAACGGPGRRANIGRGAPGEARPPVAPPAAPAEIIQGFTIYGPEARSFGPCGEDGVLLVVDPDGSFRDLLEQAAPHLEPYDKVFTIAEGGRGPAPAGGPGAGYAGTIEVGRILYMAPWEGYRCHSSALDFVYSAYGTEPFWSATVSADSIVFRLVGSGDRRWTYREGLPDDGGVVYRAGGAAGDIEISILEGACFDDMSGAYFGYSATAVVDGRVFHGCALKGLEGFRE